MTYMDATNEINAGFPSKNGLMWWALNIKADATLTWDIYEKGAALFSPHLGIPGFEWYLVAQPIP